MARSSIFRLLLALLLLARVAAAELIVNPARTIDRLLTVQVIQVARDDGSNAAPLFGSASAQLDIFEGIDLIWAQAGIDVEFKFRLAPWDDTFALSGSSSTRPSGDLNTIINRASSEGGILDPNPKVLNLFMVRVVPGFPQTDADTSNGIAFVNGNGITLWAGPNLTGFDDGHDVISSVLAHEIGHNLGLNHLAQAQNLMQSGGSNDDGERLNATQINTVRNSTFLAAVPEPGTALLLFSAVLVFGVRFRAGRN